MWSPLRARKLDKNRTLKPFVPFKTFGNPKTLNCDRDSQGDVFYADMSASVVRPHCLEKLEKGQSVNSAKETCKSDASTLYKL